MHIWAWCDVTWLIFTHNKDDHQPVSHVDEGEGGVESGHEDVGES